MSEVIGIMVVVIIILVLIVRYLLNQNRDLRFSKRSLSVKYGKAIEQFIPFLDMYPHDYNNFRFIGTPIDGLQFNDNEVIFVEFKGGNSRLSEKQRQIKSLINNRRVSWEEYRI